MMSPITTAGNYIGHYISESTSMLRSTLNDFIDSKSVPDTSTVTDYNVSFDAINKAEQMKKDVSNSNITEQKKNKSISSFEKSIDSLYKKFDELNEETEEVKY